jgi:acyl dehydratase
MAFEARRLLDWTFEPVRQSYRERDAILYALGVGLPDDPLNANELEFLLEDRLKVLPTFAVTLATPGMWVKAPALEIDWMRLLHAAQAATFHRQLPPTAEIVGHARIKSVYDRGREKGAVVVVERRILDASSEAPYCTIEQTLILRGNGGFGGEAPPRVDSPKPPPREPDRRSVALISARAALIYRLSGDLNPLHADPLIAKKAGFERPILHGLASYGIAGAQVLKAFGGNDPARLRSLSMRFAGVVMPGDRLDFSFWQDGATIIFEARAGNRTVLDQGIARTG